MSGTLQVLDFCLAVLGAIGGYMVGYAIARARRDRMERKR